LSIHSFEATYLTSAVAENMYIGLVGVADLGSLKFALEKVGALGKIASSENIFGNYR
jgi:hypothetical protein